MKKIIKKAFTLVELLVVIAIIAVLSSVSIIGFSSYISKANLAKDGTVVSEINKQIKLYKTGHTSSTLSTPSDLNDVLEDTKYNISKLFASSKKAHYAYDGETEQFLLVKGDEVLLPEEVTVSTNSQDIYVFADSQDTKEQYENLNYGIYRQSSCILSSSFEVKGSFDNGNFTDNAKITYTNTSTTAKEVSIRTNGGEFVVKGYVGTTDCDTVNHYGYAETVDIQTNGVASYHEYGTVPFAKVAQGKVEVEQEGFINSVHFVKATESSFDSTIEVVVESDDIPRFSRDAVTIAANTEVKVATLDIDDTKGTVYLTMEGIFEQAKVAPVVDGVEGSKSFVDADEVNNLNTAIKQIANTISGVKDVDYTIASDTRTLNVINSDNAVITNGVTEQEAKVSSEFRGGTGLTASDPLEIYDYYSLQKVFELYDSYRYYKIKDGVSTIDLTGWSPINLNGSFDGNGVIFTNVTSNLFTRVGYQLNNDEITIKNFSINMNVSATQQYGVASMIKQIDNAGITTFENINIHGYQEGYWNLGSFYSYGTANYDDVGCDYTVKFINCSSDSTLVCSTGNTCGGIVGHVYQGSGHTPHIYFTNTEFTGTIFTTGGTGNKWYATSSQETSGDDYYVNGVKTNITSYNQSYDNCTKISVIAPTKEDDGYYLHKESKADSIKIVITAQLTAYDDNDIAISNLSGITMTLDLGEITKVKKNNKAMDLFTSVEIINGDGQTVVEDDVLKVYTNSTANYETGTIKLQVNQYNKDSQLISCGNLTIATCENPGDAWTIN